MNTNILEETIESLSLLGEDIRKNINSEPYISMYKQAEKENPWFLQENVKYALEQFLPWLQKDVLQEFVNRYNIEDKKDASLHSVSKQQPVRKNLAIVCAGNIPAVSFHDILCGLLSDCFLQIKLSSNDKVVIPFLLGRVHGLKSRYVFVDIIKDFDFVIATGSNSSSLYFESYFKDYPHIIRKSRSSIAVITNEDDISGLEDDVFRYMGLGCRNVSLLFLPLEWREKNGGLDARKLEERFKKFSFLKDFHKYKNNYDYYKAVYQMNNIDIFDGGHYLLQENRLACCPIGVVNYCFYKESREVEDFILENKDELQCIVADKFRFSTDIPTVGFGNAQSPLIDDYADNVDTMYFLKTGKVLSSLVETC